VYVCLIVHRVLPSVLMDAYDCGDDGSDDASDATGEYGARRPRPFRCAACVGRVTAAFGTADGDVRRAGEAVDLDAGTAVESDRLTRSSVSTSSSSVDGGFWSFGMSSLTIQWA